MAPGIDRGVLLSRRSTALLVLVILCLAGPLAAQPCCNPRPVTDNTWPEDERVRWFWAAADALGGVYLGAHYDADSSFFRVSHDDGETWRPFFPVPTGRETLAAAAVDEMGNVVVAFNEGGVVYAARSSNQARSFLPPVRLGDTEDRYWPQIAMGPDGLTVITFGDVGGPGPSLRWFAAVSPDRGRTWDPPSLLPDMGSRYATGFSDSSILVALVSNLVIYATVSADGGMSWSEPALVGDVDRSGRINWILFGDSGEGRVQVFWGAEAAPVGMDANEVSISASEDGGLTWPDQTTLLERVDMGGGAPAGDLVSRAGGSVHVVWTMDSSSPIFLNHSAEHGVLGTWLSEPLTVVPRGFSPRHPRMTVSPIHVLDVTHTDFRDDALCPGGATCVSVYLERSCDDGLTWLPSLRLDDDTPPQGTISTDPELAVSNSGRIHVVWIDEADGPAQVGQIHHVGLDPAIDAPRMTLTGGPATECGPHTYELHVVMDSVTWCSDPTFRWSVDGNPIPGAWGPDFTVPDWLEPGLHTFHYEVFCPEAAPCGNLATPYTLTLAPLEVPRPGQIDGRLFVSRTGPDLQLRWQDLSPDATGYNVYQGEVPALHRDRAYNHAGLACHLERQPPDATLLTHGTPTPGVFAYYLVAPATCAAEGNVGTDSEDLPRPVAGTPPACGPLPAP